MADTTTELSEKAPIASFLVEMKEAVKLADNAQRVISSLTDMVKKPPEKMKIPTAITGMEKDLLNRGNHLSGFARGWGLTADLLEKKLITAEMPALRNELLSRLQDLRETLLVSEMVEDHVFRSSSYGKDLHKLLKKYDLNAPLDSKLQNKLEPAFKEMQGNINIHEMVSEMGGRSSVFTLKG